MALDRGKINPGKTYIHIFFLLFIAFLFSLWGCKTVDEPMLPDNQALVYVFSGSKITVGGFSIERYNEKFFYALEEKSYNYYLFSPGQVLLLRGTLPAYEKLFDLKAGKRYYFYFDDTKNEFQIITDEDRIGKLLKSYKQSGEDLEPNDNKELITGDKGITLFDYAAASLDENLLTLLLIKGIPYNEEAIPAIMMETLNNGNQILYDYLESRGFFFGEPEVEPPLSIKPESSPLLLDDLTLEKEGPLYFEPDRFYSSDHNFSIKYPESWVTAEKKDEGKSAELMKNTPILQKQVEFKAVNPVSEPDTLALVSISTLDLDELLTDLTSDDMEISKADIIDDSTDDTGPELTGDVTDDMVIDSTHDIVIEPDMETRDDATADAERPSLLDLAFERNIEKIKEDVFGYEEFERGEMVLEERTFKWVVYTDQMILIKKYYLVKKNKLYIIKCSSLPEEFDDFEEHFSRMVQSIRFE